MAKNTKAAGTEKPGEDDSGPQLPPHIAKAMLHSMLRASLGDIGGA